MRPLYMELSVEDWELLRRIADATGHSRAQIMRWALRYYAVKGNWPKNSRERLELVGGKYLETGTRKEGV